MCPVRSIVISSRSTSLGSLEYGIMTTLIGEYIPVTHHILTFPHSAVHPSHAYGGRTVTKAPGSN